MSYELLLLAAIILGALALFITEKMAIEAVAFLVLLALFGTQLVPAENILDGFANPATMTVAAMFVLSAALQRTGVVAAMARKLKPLAGKVPEEGQKVATYSWQIPRLSGILGGTAGVLSGFINNTATVSVFLPVALRMCKERGISPTRVLMPLSFCAQFGGVCTLIGTTTNLIVHGYAKAAGLPGFGLFEFAQLGVIMFVVGFVYLFFVSWFFLPDRATAENATETFDLQNYTTELCIQEASVLIGQTGEDNKLVAADKSLGIMEVIRDGKALWNAANMKMREGDVLLVHGAADKVLELAPSLGLEDWADRELTDQPKNRDDMELTEILIPRGSRFMGKSLNQLDFYWRFHAAVLGIRRQNAQGSDVLHGRLAHTPLQEGDMLLVQGHSDDLSRLKENPHAVYLRDVSDVKLNSKRAILALLAMGAFLVMAAMPNIPVLFAAFAAAALMVAFKCIKLTDAYEAIDLRVVILLAGLLPLGFAMQSTGMAELLAGYVQHTLGALGPVGLLIGMYVLTMLLTELMSNTATAALLAPLAIGLAGQMGLSPVPFLVAITFAASTSFMTPVGYQTNMMIYAPGGYKYTDFLKIGLPLNLIFLAIAAVMIPRIWGF